MDFQFIKKEEPVDFVLYTTNQDEVSSASNYISKDFCITEDVNIKQEPDQDLIVKTEAELPLSNDGMDYEISEIKPFITIANEPVCERTDYIVDNFVISLKENNGVAKDEVLKKSFVRKPKSKAKHIGTHRYKCKKCKFSCNPRTLLLSHVAKHDQSDVDQCKICLRFFPISLVQFHTDSHDGPPYTCQICSKTFSIRRSWYKHRFYHTDDELCECDICGKKLRSKKTMLEHLMTMHLQCERKKDYKCTVCDTSYFRQNTLNRHVKKIHSSLGYRCSNKACDRAFTEKSALDSHRCKNINRRNILTHYSGDTHRCEKCNKMLYSLQRYVMHVAQNCSDILMYECDYCSEAIPRKDKLMGHFKHNHKIPELNEMCKLCSRIFADKGSLQRHFIRCSLFQTEEERALNAFKCSKCAKIFHSFDRIVLHIEQNCIDKIMYSCYYCSRAFLDKTVLLYHFGSYHHISEINRQKCRICEKSFPTKGMLGKHFKTHENKELSEQFYECKYCNQIFSRSFAYRMHSKRCVPLQLSKKYSNHLADSDSMEQKHEQFKCDICNCVFLCKSYIVEHMLLVHSRKEVRPKNRQTDKTHGFKCSVCKKLFKRRKGLTFHIRRLHNDSRKSFTCESCNKKFFNERKYLAHRKGLHCGKKIQCTYCSEVFAHNSGLIRHSKRCGKNLKRNIVGK